MQCPVCSDTSLMMTERQGIEIDYCPRCRGVWLDRGELDKIIERSLDQDNTPAAAPPTMTYQQPAQQPARQGPALQPWFRLRPSLPEKEIALERAV
jgi:Zn-finger nucleic acid-binding protein